MFISTRKVPCNIVSDSVQSVAFAVSGVAKRIIPIRSALVFMPKPCLKMRPEDRFLRTLRWDAGRLLQEVIGLCGLSRGLLGGRCSGRFLPGTPVAAAGRDRLAGRGRRGLTVGRS